VRSDFFIQSSALFSMSYFGVYLINVSGKGNDYGSLSFEEYGDIKALKAYLRNNKHPFENFAIEVRHLQFENESNREKAVEMLSAAGECIDYDSSKACQFLYSP
jgi:hypothetical protein